MGGGLVGMRSAGRFAAREKGRPGPAASSPAAAGSAGCRRRCRSSRQAGRRRATCRHRPTATFRAVVGGTERGGHRQAGLPAGASRERPRRGAAPRARPRSPRSRRPPATPRDYRTRGRAGAGSPPSCSTCSTDRLVDYQARRVHRLRRRATSRRHCRPPALGRPRRADGWSRPPDVPAGRAPAAPRRHRRATTRAAPVGRGPRRRRRRASPAARSRSRETGTIVLGRRRPAGPAGTHAGARPATSSSSGPSRSCGSVPEALARLDPAAAAHHDQRPVGDERHRAATGSRASTAPAPSSWSLVRLRARSNASVLDGHLTGEPAYRWSAARGVLPRAVPVITGLRSAPGGGPPGPAGGGDLGWSAVLGAREEIASAQSVRPEMALDDRTAPTRRTWAPGVGLTLGAVVAARRLSTSCLTRRPHEVSTTEAAGWSAFYIALPAGVRRLDLGALGLGPGHGVHHRLPGREVAARSTTCSSSCSCSGRSRCRPPCSSGCCSSASSARWCCAAVFIAAGRRGARDLHARRSSSSAHPARDRGEGVLGTPGSGHDKEVDVSQDARRCACSAASCP